jgi:3-deoxy-7-phosphoheptulonate synthase
MLIMLGAGTSPEECDALREKLDALGTRTRALQVNGQCVLVCNGAAQPVEGGRWPELPRGATTMAAPRSYVLATREMWEGHTVLIPGPVPIHAGDGRIVLAAGPCSVEGSAVLKQVAAGVRDAGAVLLRGGAFKPRTSPYAFSGLGIPALEMLSAARAATGLAIVSEVMDARQIECMIPHVDVFQVGARNMQNYSLLAELGQIRRPVLLKRGAAATVEELLLAAEHVLSRGNTDVILCERGVRGQETLTRNTLDVGAVAVLKRETHLPVFVDPSHAAGRADLVPALALAAVAAGCDGLLIEVHPAPEDALSDGAQSLTPQAFAELARQIAAVAGALGRSVVPAPRAAEVAA